MLHSRYLLLTPVIAVAPTAVYAQAQQKLIIESATVFLSGAELQSTAHLSLAKGENEIIFTNVAGDVNSQSITVSAGNGVVVESATFQNNYLANETLSPRARDIKDSIEWVTANNEATANKIAVLDEQIAILRANQKVGGSNTGLSVAELSKLLDLVGTKMEGILIQKTKEQDRLKKMDERLVKLKKQLDEEQKRDYQPGGQLLVKFYAQEAANTGVTISYIVPHAGWSPTYDVMADDAKSPVRLYYKANIYQNSGVRWNNVRLSLSTGNPVDGVEAPAMNPWYLAFYVPQTYNAVAAYSKSMQAVPSVEVKDLVASSPGLYQRKRGQETSSINQYVSVDNAGVNTTFDIDLPYTIPSDGQQHLVAIKEYNVPATYRYYAAPKIDKDAFLQAQITNWEDLNLLPGQTNIFYEGTYVGQGMIDVQNIKDTMAISLGRDKKIVVKREQDKKLRSVKTIGTNVRETFAYTITVRNTRKESVNLTIQDQQPVANDKDIVVEDKNTGDANEYDEATGMMEWAITLGPNETRKINFGYTIKYPKGKTVTNLQ